MKAAAPTPRARPTFRQVGAGLLCGLLLGLLVFAPARWLAAALPAGSPVQLSDARGSLWQGSARLWLSGGAGSPDRAALPQRLRWHWRLDGGSPALHLHADCCTPQGLQLALGLQEGSPVLRLSDGQSNWPADWLSGLGTPWNTLQPSGQLSLSTQGLQLQLRDGAVQGRATLELHEAASALSTLRPIGSYRLQVQAGGTTTLELQTLRGALLLSGQGQWQRSGLQFRGEARAAEGREAALANILHIIGKREGSRTLFSLG